MTAVLDAVRQHLRKVKSSGSENVMAICPFHRGSDGREESGPSFAMNTSSGLWFCHSCHSRGNLYMFLRNVGMSHAVIKGTYQQALDEAERHIPVTPDPLNPVAPTKEPLDDSLLGLFDYYPQLMADEGFPPELCRRFGVGFDERHLRVTFPLRNNAGVLVGISGRTIANAKPRYKVYDKEYLAFGLAPRETQKRSLLWNAHEVLEQLAHEKDAGKRFAVVVEGFKAAMRVAQAGISTVVALLGSHLSNEQQWVLERMEVPIYLMPDNDHPGRVGCMDAAERLIKGVCGLHFVEYDAPQPSDLSPEEVVTAITTAKPFTVWFHQQLAPNQA